jgi:hypothetical protein
MRSKPLTHHQMLNIKRMTFAQRERADRIGIPPEMRKLSVFGNLHGITDKLLYIIGRDGKVMFEGRRR